MKYTVKEWPGGKFEVECDIPEIKPICQTEVKAFAEMICDALNEQDQRSLDELFSRMRSPS